MAGKSPAFLPAVRLLPIRQRRGGCSHGGFPAMWDSLAGLLSAIAEGGRLIRMERKYFVAVVQCPVNYKRLSRRHNLFYTLKIFSSNYTTFQQKWRPRRLSPAKMLLSQVLTPVLPQSYPKVAPCRYASNNFEQVEHQALDLRLFNPLLAMAAMSPFSISPPNQQQMCNPFSPLSKTNTLR